MEKERKEKLDNLIDQAMQALNVFETSGNRTAFVALQDQAKAYHEEYPEGDE